MSQCNPGNQTGRKSNDLFYFLLEKFCGEVTLTKFRNSFRFTCLSLKSLLKQHSPKPPMTSSQNSRTQFPSTYELSVRTVFTRSYHHLETIFCEPLIYLLFSIVLYREIFLTWSSNVGVSSLGPGLASPVTSFLYFRQMNETKISKTRSQIPTKHRTTLVHTRNRVYRYTSRTSMHNSVYTAK